jgi:DNA-binding beta-propeller fold protein YncE
VKHLALGVLALLLVGCGGSGEANPTPAATVSPSASASASASTSPTPAAPTELLVVASSYGSALSLIDPRNGRIESRLQVGSAPHQIVRAGDVGYVGTAVGLSIVSLGDGRVLATLPYDTDVGPASKGEFREGGMGLAASPDGQRAYVAVYTAGGSYLEEFDLREGFKRGIQVGTRPFDVVVDPNGGAVYTIDHDSYTLTAVDVATWTARIIDIAPLGRGAYDKPHYGAIAGRELLLPFQGKTLLAYNLDTGATREIPLSANTHQHGIVVTPDGATAVIVGTGPAGEATGGPSLTILTLADGKERVIPLTKAHEDVVLSTDGKNAYLSGGYLMDGGWDGITVVNLETGATREFYVPDRPLGMAVLSN